MNQNIGAIFAIFTPDKLLRVWQIALILFAISGVWATDNVKLESIKSNSIQTDFYDSSTKNSKSPPHLPYADSPLFSYSKNDKNIVVIVLDMFSGSHTPYILEQFPQFMKQLDGFTLFPNALSTTNATAHSITTLIGGEYYAIYNMNKRKNNLAQEIRQGYENTGIAFANSGFSVSYMSDMYSNLIDNPKIHLVSDYKIFEPYFYERHNLKNAIESYREQTRHYESLDLISFGLFRFAPKYRAREKIYNNGDWLYDKMPNLLAHIAHASNTYAPTHIIRIDSNKPTFKFFHTSMTHFPFAVYFNGKECEFGGKKSAWNDYPHEEKITDKQFFQHYDSEACAMQYLTEYINLLKNVGIYDNTQIFVVSDHGGDVSFGTPKFAYRPDVLFLFKDFGTRGNLKIDNRLMANYDIASIFCANLKGGCPNVAPNILQNYPNNREIIYMIPYHWILEKHKLNEWLINKAYKVKDNIYDEKNWTDISDESYGIVNTKK